MGYCMGCRQNVRDCVTQTLAIKRALQRVDAKQHSKGVRSKIAEAIDLLDQLFVTVGDLEYREDFDDDCRNPGL
jgi:hypothetical protein